MYRDFNLPAEQLHSLFYVYFQFSDIEDVAHHKYQVLEECLFYKLTSDADRMQGTFFERRIIRL